MNAEDKLKELKDLCVKKKEDVRKMLDLLQKANHAEAVGRMGWCSPRPEGPNFTAFACTQAECNLIPGDWSLDHPTEQEYQDFVACILLKYPAAAREAAEALNQEYKNNSVFKQLVDLLQAVNEGQPGEPVGICLSKTGEYSAATKAECEGDLSIISFHPPPRKKSQA
jgi:hypothetical protein